MTKLSDLNVSLKNRAILVDVSHAKVAGDEVKTPGGLVIGRVEVSESPTYGVVVAYDPSLEGQVGVGDVIPLPTTGVLRMFDWPGRDKAEKVAIIRFDTIDGVITPK